MMKLCKFKFHIYGDFCTLIWSKNLSLGQVACVNLAKIKMKYHNSKNWNFKVLEDFFVQGGSINKRKVAQDQKIQNEGHLCFFNI